MSGKVTRLAFQQLIAEDIAWLEKQPRTLEREHIIMCVRESERYCYVDAQDDEVLKLIDEVQAKFVEMRDTLKTSVKAELLAFFDRLRKTVALNRGQSTETLANSVLAHLDEESRE